MGVDSSTTLSLFLFTTTIWVGFLHPSPRRGNGGSENYVCYPAYKLVRGGAGNQLQNWMVSVAVTFYPSILVTLECPQLQGQPPDWGTEGGSLGGSVLQCSGSYSGAGSA